MKSINLIAGLAVLLLPATGAAADRDFVMKFGQSDIASMTVDGEPFDTVITGGLAVLDKVDRDCVVTVDTTCDYTIDLVEFYSAGFDFTLNGKDAAARDIVTGLGQPTEVTDFGSGLTIQPGFESYTAFDLTFNNNTFRRIKRRNDVGSVTLFLVEETGQVSYIADFQGTTSEGLSVEYFVTGTGELVNSPPHAIGSVTSLSDECSVDPVVSASAVDSYDPDGQELEYYWLEEGAVVGQGATAEWTTTPGSHSYTLLVRDSAGGVAEKTFGVEVEADVTPPMFSFVPENATADSCHDVSFADAVAQDECGGLVELSNDAPSSYKAGATQVTWEASDAAGNTATVTHRVVVGLGGDSSCCPAGSNVILGTSNNDSIVGTEGVDCILTFNSQDTVDGRGGNDLIDTGDGDDTVKAGLGDDFVWLGSGQDRAELGEGNDFVDGQDGDDVLYCGSGADTALGGQGQDRLYGESGNDSLLGEDGDDQIYGGAGDDVMDGGSNNNRCTGGDGYDVFLMCMAEDTAESYGDPAYEGSSDYTSCECRATKCNDCTSSASECDAIEGCPQILECVQATTGCNLPHECSEMCETGRTQEAVAAARTVASCMGGCQ